MRLFLAINLPSDIKGRLFGVGRPLNALGDVKLVEEENIHLTLKFLGDAEPETVIRSLESVRFKPFEVSLNSVGVFPSPNCVRVVWAGCEKGAKEIVSLHETIETALFHCMKRFEKDGDFHPHATLARVRFLRNRKAMADFLEKNKNLEMGSFKAASFDLVESKLGGGGPKYEIMKKFTLI